MATSKFTSLPSLRRQNLLAEFAGLKQACPDGVFVSLTPGDPSLWSGVIFVRDGPYAPAVLRFQISFPDTYPNLPPLVTFSTDMFHPLIATLTNQMHSSGPQEGGAPHGPDDDRLPPGGFSLRHGFPAWFRRSTSNAPTSRKTSGPQTPPRPTGYGSTQSTPNSAESPLAGKGRGSITSAATNTPNASTPKTATPSYLQTQPTATDISTHDVLDYIRSTFDDAAVLDSIPLEAAGDPNAWHAWRTHQRQQGHELPEMGGDNTDTGKWNWEHVWENRVRENISNSLSDPVMYGSAGAADDVIRFLSMEEGEVETIKENLKRTLGAPVS